MKKTISFIGLAVIFLCSVFVILGTETANHESASSAYESQTTYSIQKLSASENRMSYSVHDICNLQDFLLLKSTGKDIESMDYDLNGDNILNILDLCLIKRKYLSQNQSASENILVAYFSQTGNTETIANYIAQLTGADSYKIEAADPYTDDDINYTDSSCRANEEQNDKSVRPEIASPLESIDAYDIIYLGYPIWWNQEPRIIDTFLESYDFSDKTIIPFCTSGGSSISTSENNIKNLGVSIGNQLSGRRFSTGASIDDVSEWIDSLPLNKEEKLLIEVNGYTLTATLADNSSAQALAELIANEPLTLELSDYGNFEKVGPLPESLPRNDETITTEPGDIILYQGNQITIYYDENTWNFTRLGKIENITKENLLEILGDGDVTVTLSITYV